MSKLLSQTETAAKLGCSIENFRKKIKFINGFPKPIKFDDKSHPKWREIDIDNYINEKAA